MNFWMKEFPKLNLKTSTFVDIVQYHAANSGNKKIFTFLSDGLNTQESLSYAELDIKARKIAACLQSLNMKGKRALLLYPPGLEYIAGFFGCLYAGVVAVPAYPPSLTALERSLPRLEIISRDAEASLVLTTEKIKSLMQVYFSRLPRIQEPKGAMKRWNESSAAAEISSLNWIATDSLLESSDGGSYKEWQISPGETAFLQYTSGSTGSPKGVIVSHQNLIHNSILIKNAFRVDPDNMEVVLWLPFYHDMGLIGGVLQPVFSGVHTFLMSPISFLGWPLKWIQIISSIKDKSVVSGGPNFAYELCMKRLSTEQIENLNLSRWDIAFTAAEPVRAETIENFSTAFKPAGFRKEAFFPCYGMAETTLIVTGKSYNTNPVIETFDKKSLQGKMPSSNACSQETSAQLVGCGKTQGDLRVLIVDPETKSECQTGEIGEIWIAGPSVANGYWKKKDDTNYTFNAFTSDSRKGPFLRSGDLGFLDKNNELFVAGRLKDLIIIRGRNFYPQDIELTVEKSHPALRVSSVAAFSIEEQNEERLVIVQEISTGEHSQDQIIEKIREAISDEFEIQAYSIVLIKAKTIAKTSSGKIQRQEVRRQYLSGYLNIVKESKLFSRTAGANPREWHEPLDLALNIKANPDINNIGEWLINALSAILKTELQNISPGRSISSFGMDSLMMVELKNDIEAKLGICVSISDFFRHSTLSMLSHKILEQMSAGNNLATHIKPSIKKGDVSVLSYGQKSLWFMQQLEPDNAAYNVFFAVRIQSELDVNALKKSLDIIVERHTSLRTIYLNNGNEPLQKIQARGNNYFSITDARKWNEDELNEKIKTEAHRPFDLNRGPVFKTSLFEISDNEYILLLNYHHIAVDLWSIVIMLSELRTAYPAIKRGEKPELKHIDINYTDFANWQKTFLESPDGRDSFDYWKHQLSGQIPLVNLPTDKSRPPVKTYNGAVFSFQINNKITNRLKTIVRDENSTLYIVLLAAFNIFLSKYANQDEIVVGSPAAGRNHPELENIVGYFVNTMVLRSHLNIEISFREYMHNLRKVVLDALDHQDYPFSLLVEKIQHYRAPGRSPFFDVMFVLERPHLLKELDLAGFILSESGAKINIGGLKMESYFIEQKVAQFDLTLSIVEKADSLSASFQFNTDLFEKSTIRQMAGHFLNLLTEVSENPSKRINEMSLISERERYALLNMWNSLNNNYQDRLLIHELFEEQVKLKPQAPAVIFNGEEVTYRQLNELAERIKHFLLKKDLPAETPVGIYSRKSIGVIAGILAIFKAGCTYIPLDPEYPEERINYMTKDAGISVVLTQDKLYGRIARNNLEAVNMDDSRLDETPLENNSSRKTEPESAAYVIYTSGSTGKPKGVVVSHQALANHCCQIKNSYATAESDRVLGFSSMNFDASLEQIFTTLISGAALVLKDEELLSPNKFLGMLNSNSITVLNIPPAYFEQLVNEWAKCEHLSFNRLRLLIIGGDVIYFNTVKKWFSLKTGGIRLLNAYGPTETTITSVAGETGSELVRNGERCIPIGKPQANRTAYILDSKGNLVPKGVVGELHIGGSCLARGYLGNPDLTAEKFIPDPFSRHEGQRLYKTGDLARYLADGSIEFIGRVDHQVKIRGFRVELGEIEMVLRMHPSVKEAAAVLKQNPEGDKSISVYLVTGEKYDENELKNYLRQQLPDFLIPSNFVKMKQLPLTPAGKLDRSALSSLQKDFSSHGEPFASPRTPLEKNIAGIFTEVLEVSNVGLYDNFFELGGHSLLAIKTLSRINSFYKTDLTVRQMFENPTVAGLSGAILSIQIGADQKEINDMLSGIENLSDDEVRKLLNDSEI